MKPTMFGCAVVGLLLALQPATADEMPDLAKLVRAPRKEPAYLSKRPLYGLAAFGAKAEKAVWLVLDKSKPEGGRYDVLYIDLNGDGDLTSAGERVTPGKDGRFRLDEFTDPTGVEHKEFTLRVE